MMDYKKIYTMEAIKKNEMLLILGGVEAESCADVIAEGNAHGPNDENFDWADWSERFEVACL